MLVDRRSNLSQQVGPRGVDREGEQLVEYGTVVVDACPNETIRQAQWTTDVVDSPAVHRLLGSCRDTNHCVSKLLEL